MAAAACCRSSAPPHFAASPVVCPVLHFHCIGCCHSFALLHFDTSSAVCPILLLHDFGLRLPPSLAAPCLPGGWDVASQWLLFFHMPPGATAPMGCRLPATMVMTDATHVGAPAVCALNHQCGAAAGRISSWPPPLAPIVVALRPVPSTGVPSRGLDSSPPRPGHPPSNCARRLLARADSPWVSSAPAPMNLTLTYLVSFLRLIPCLRCTLDSHGMPRVPLPASPFALGLPGLRRPNKQDGGKYPCHRHARRCPLPSERGTCSGGFEGDRQRRRPALKGAGAWTLCSWSSNVWVAGAPATFQVRGCRLPRFVSLASSHVLLGRALDSVG